MKKLLPFIITIALLGSVLTGCGSLKSETTDSSNSSAEKISSDPMEVDFSQTADDMFTERDYDSTYDEDSSIRIQLNGSSASASSDNVKISGTSITLTEEATYIISGTLDDGMIIVDAPDTAKLQIVLNGIDINSESSAALYILNGDKVFVTLADGTENALSNGGTFEMIDESNIDGAVFSRQDLTFNGSGSLTVSSPAGHGIVCKDDLVFTGGTYAVDAASHGLDANDSVRIANASLTVTAGKDGIHAENTEDASLGFFYMLSGSINTEAEGDGISAGSYVQMEDGEMEILAGGGNENGTKASSDSYGEFRGGKGTGSEPGRGTKPGQGTKPDQGTRPEQEMDPEQRMDPEQGIESKQGASPEQGMEPLSSVSETTATADDGSTSMKGIKAVSGILISDGTITVDSADDGIHSDASVVINGGNFELASGDDGIHGEDTLTITACTMNISTSYEGLEAQEIYIKGGDITVNSSDDGVNASGGTDSSGVTGGRDGKFEGGSMSSPNGNIEISGGSLTVYASGDGLDSNGTLTISGGYVSVANPSSGDTSVIDCNSSPIITGGTFVSTGSSTMMAQSFDSSSSQGVIACITGTQPEGAQITVADEDGNVLISYEAEYTCVLVIISSPDIVKGKNYAVTAGSFSETVTAN